MTSTQALTSFGKDMKQKRKVSSETVIPIKAKGALLHPKNIVS
jgi:hypothetical protein